MSSAESLGDFMKESLRVLGEQISDRARDEPRKALRRLWDDIGDAVFGRKEFAKTDTPNCPGVPGLRGRMSSKGCGDTPAASGALRGEAMPRMYPVEDLRNLLVGWAEVSEPLQVEDELKRQHEAEYGMLP